MKLLNSYFLKRLCNKIISSKTHKQLLFSCKKWYTPIIINLAKQFQKLLVFSWIALLLIENTSILVWNMLLDLVFTIHPQWLAFNFSLQWLLIGQKILKTCIKRNVWQPVIIDYRYVDVGAENPLGEGWQRMCEWSHNLTIPSKIFTSPILVNNINFGSKKYL